MSEPAARELLPAPASGRTFSAERMVRLADVDPDGELRFDAVARYLQDVASDDAFDAALSNAMGWVVRRTLIRVDHPAAVGERLRLTTFCTGSGRSWAERRTSLVGEHGASMDAVSLWIQVDPDSGRPSRLGHDFVRIYGESAGGRMVSPKLALPARPPDHAERQNWAYRRADLDQFGHVNNAAHWSAVEEVLQRGGVTRRGVGEIEFVTPADAGDLAELLVDHDMIWVVAHGKTLIAARWNPAD
jgi:acyl-ACP thioesterase